jgi:predicted aminopeptidase
MHRSRAVTLLLAAILAAAGSGCYYGHLALGQARLLRARVPIDRVLEDPETSPELARRLRRVQEARSFAARLGLEVGRQYTSYVPWPGDRIVTTVVAARPGEVVAAGFGFPFLGRLPYKGFFARERAEAEADALRRRGLDTCVLAVPAYSTLGWIDDPVTGPLLRRSEGELVETVLHELVHATFFARDHPDFNEGVASFIGEEASVRFFAELDGGAREDRERERIEDARALAAAILDFRDQVAALYALGLEEEEGRRRKDLEEQARAAIAGLGLRSLDSHDVAERVRLNDACLAQRGTYAADTPRHIELLRSMGGDLHSLVARLRAIEGAEDPRSAFFEGP